MSALRVVHLLDDFELGGITKSLSFHAHPELSDVAESEILAVKPSLSIAPALGADVIITHFPPAWRFLPFLLSLKVRNPRARLVHVEHSYTGAWAALKVARPARFRTMLRIAYSLFHQIVAVSHGQAVWLRSTVGVSSDKVRVIEPWSGNQGLEAVAPIESIMGRPLVIGAYGRFAEQKGFDTLIAAMKLLPPADFTLSLGGFGPDRVALKAAAMKCTNVTFAGKVTDVADFLANCDVVVIPSRWEAFGQVAAEARLAGRPIIVADVDGLPEQVGMSGIIADCSTAESLAQALKSLPGLPLAAMGQAGRESVRGAEAGRVALWQSLYADLTVSQRATSRPIARALQPIRISAGQ